MIYPVPNNLTRSVSLIYGSVIPLKDLELYITTDEGSIIQTLKNSSYAAIFTEGSIEEN
jgi:hypothetical protein